MGKTKELQTYIYFLMKTHILDLEGIPFKNEDGVEEFVSKSAIAEGMCDVLNTIAEDHEEEGK